MERGNKRWRVGSGDGLVFSERVRFRENEVMITASEKQGGGGVGAGPREIYIYGARQRGKEESEGLKKKKIVCEEKGGGKMLRQ